MRVEFWFEFASTYSYLAAERVPREVLYRPFLLGPIFQKRYGFLDSPFNRDPARGAYMWRDLERMCTKLGLPWRKPSVFPRNGLLAARVAILCAEEPWIGDFVRGVYRANFAEDRDIADPSVVAGVLASLGKPRSLLDDAQTGANKERLRAQTARAEELGIFGAPSFLAGGELFFGNERLEDALAWR